MYMYLYMYMKVPKFRGEWMAPKTHVICESFLPQKVSTIWYVVMDKLHWKYHGRAFTWFHTFRN